MTGSPSETATPALSYVVPTIGVSEHLERCLASIYRDGERLEGPSELVVVWQAPVGGSAEGVRGAVVGGAGDAGGSAALEELCRRLATERPGAIDGTARIVELPRPVGFARAANDGIAVSGGDWVALVNDDVVLEAGWARRLLDAAGAASGVAAAQGINVVAGGGGGDGGGGSDRDGEDPRVDGAGLEWNRRWQAVQPGRAEAVDEWVAHWVRRRPRRLPDEAPHWVRRRPRRPLDETPHWVRRRPRRLPPKAARKRAGRQAGTAHEVYGVAATAAIYRRDALVEVSGAGEALRPFEERLDSYYEDVELADRLRGAGYRALLVPAARAVHAGALSSRRPRAARRRTRRVYANRLLVLARRLGRGFWPRLPIVLGRDIVDALRRPKTEPPMPGDLEPPGIVDLVCAWGRAARLLPWFAHFGRLAEGRKRSRPNGRRVSWPPSAAAGGDAGAPSGESHPKDAGAPSRESHPKDAGDAGAPSRESHPKDAGDAGAPSGGSHPKDAGDGGAPSGEPHPAAGGDAGAPSGESLSVRPVLTAVAPHWHDEEHLAVLVRAWPVDARFELIVVDNGSDGDLNALAADRSNVRVLEPGRNLGFAAAVNRGVAEAGGDLILILNTDAVPEPGALDALVEGMTDHPDAAGLAPRLLGADDTAQAAWQLRRLPTLRTLAGYCCFVEPAPLPEPAAGAPVEQPAACALLLRRSAFESAGAMDERFWPAWFEDVDLARRLADRGERVLYWPEAVFRHGLGASVPRLGYGGFLAAYYRNLDRYARKHHGRGAALLLRAVLVGAALLRIVLLPLRRPRRARGRGEALAGLWRLAVGAVTGWRGR